EAAFRVGGGAIVVKRIPNRLLTPHNGPGDRLAGRLVAYDAGDDPARGGRMREGRRVIGVYLPLFHSRRGHGAAFVQANVPNLEAGPCQYIDHLGFNGRPFNGEGHDTLAADALDLEATGLVGGNRRKEMAEPVNAVGRQVLVHGEILTGALVLGRLDKP